jgi:hypothetical protein
MSATVWFGAAIVLGGEPSRVSTLERMIAEPSFDLDQDWCVRPQMVRREGGRSRTRSRTMTNCPPVRDPRLERRSPCLDAGAPGVSQRGHR